MWTLCVSAGIIRYLANQIYEIWEKYCFVHISTIIHWQESWEGSGPLYLFISNLDITSFDQTCKFHMINEWCINNNKKHSSVLSLKDFILFLLTLWIICCKYSYFCSRLLYDFFKNNGLVILILTFLWEAGVV